MVQELSLSSLQYLPCKLSLRRQLDVALEETKVRFFLIEPGLGGVSIVSIE